jgi:hypothetical protein
MIFIESLLYMLCAILLFYMGMMYYKESKIKDF